MTKKPNAVLAYKVLDHIDADPDSWNQGAWYVNTRCGTRACFAGWTVLLAGHEITPNPSDPEWIGAIDGEDKITIQEVAISDLGIADATAPCPLGCCSRGDDAATALFDATNSREALGRLVGEIFGPRPGPK